MNFIKLKLIEQLLTECQKQKLSKDQQVLKVGDKEFIIKYKYGIITNLQSK